MFDKKTEEMIPALRKYIVFDYSGRQLTVLSRDSVLSREKFLRERYLSEKRRADEFESINVRLRHDEQLATKALTYLAGKLSTDEKISSDWIQEALKRCKAKQ